MDVSEQEERSLLQRYRQNMRRARQRLNSKASISSKIQNVTWGLYHQPWRHATGAVPDIYHHTASDPTWINTTTPMAGIPRYRYRSTSNVDVKSGRASGRIRPPTADPGDTVARHDPLPPTEERMAQRLALHKSRHKNSHSHLIEVRTCTLSRLHTYMGQHGEEKKIKRKKKLRLLPHTANSSHGTTPSAIVCAS